MINTVKKTPRCTSALAVLALTVAGGLSSPMVHAGTVDISPTPPDLTTTVAPNIVLSFDDSGSMMGTAMPDSVSSYDDADNKYYYSSNTNTIYYNPDITYNPPLYPDGASFPDASYTKSWRDGLCANFAGANNSSGSYCDEKVHTVNLRTEFVKEFVHEATTRGVPNDWTENAGNTQWIPEAMADDDGSGGSRDYYGGFYYVCPDAWDNAGCLQVRMNESEDQDNPPGTDQNVTDEERVNFANWYSYYRTRNLMARTAVSRAFVPINRNYRVAWQTLNNQELDSDTEIRAIKGTTSDSWRYKFFHFLYDIHKGGSTPNRRATIRAGKFFERDETLDAKDPYWNGENSSDGDGVPSKRLACRQNFHILVTDGYWNWSSNPSLPSEWQTAEDSISDGLPDGTAYTAAADASAIFWNVAGSELKSSLANIAFNYWATDLQPDLPNEVSPSLADITTGVTGSDPLEADEDPWANKEIYWNPKNDPATWQHMVNYMITMGVSGKRDFPDDYATLRQGTLAWPRPQNNDPEGIDDTWHAALVSRGAYLSAANPAALESSLKKVLSSVEARTTSSVSSSVSGAVLTTDTYAYLPSYSSSNWTGDLEAHAVNSDGTLDSVVVWSAADLLDSRDPDGRLIATSKLVSGDLDGVAFQWADLGSAEKTALQTLPDGTTDSSGKERLEWLRGDDAKEGDGLRMRTSIMGPVINSQPLYVAYPASGYRNYWPEKIGGVDVTAPENTAMDDDAADCADTGSCDSYEQFVHNNLNRNPVVYVAANDGMLHAFDAGTGAELWAYVPHAVYDKLSAQSLESDYSFVPTVDGSIVTQNVFFGDAWHTILVGSLGLGGRGIYALDITDPSASSEADVANKFLWEFTYQSDGADPATPATENNPANLGYTFGQPYIARLANGKWVVLVSGGYFPDCSSMGAPTMCDSSIAAAGQQQSSLFVLDAKDGSLIRELRTPDSETSFGLASPVVGDYNADQVADVAFAGDLQGNLWRFDLSDPAPANWKVNLIYKPSTAGLQPITSMPRLFPNRKGRGFVVVFGTGKYLGISDRTAGSSAPVQAVYGIREPGTMTSSKYTVDDLVQQQVKEQLTTVGGESVYARALTKEPVPADKDGWYFNLPVNGERVVVTPGRLPSSNRALIATLIPGNNNPCDPNRTGAIMVVDAVTGGAAPGISGPLSELSWSDGAETVGARVVNPPTKGTVPVVPRVGGGKAFLIGIDYPGKSGVGVHVYRRRSWRVLQGD